jgi:hypothetical protein
MLSAMAGFIAGSLHVITGPDHIAALLPIAAHDPKRATSLGIRWGLGHGLAVLAVGGIVVLTKQAYLLEAVTPWSEVLVGILLIALGAWSLFRARGIVVHAHPHHHDERPDHAHFHVHDKSDAHGEGVEKHHGHGHAALGIGALHGLAGTGHLFGVLPSLALSPLEATAYLAAYLLAAVVSMGAVGHVTGRLAQSGGPSRVRNMLYGTSVCAMGIGCVWVTMQWPT